MARTTPGKGIRYPLLTDAPDPNALMAFAFDLETIANAEDALRVTALTQRGALIQNSVVPSVAKGVAVKFTFDTSVFDPQGFANLGVNNDRFTITKPGLYLFGGQWNPQASGLSQYEMTIAKNTTGGPAVPNFRRHKYGPPAFGGSPVGSCVTAPFPMVAGDFVTLQTFWNGTPAGPLTGSKPQFWVLPLALT